MLTPRKLLRRLRALVARRRLDQELDEEFGFHLELEARRLAADGLDPAEARRRARVNFGPIQSFKEAARDARGLSAIHDFSRDLRHGLRALAHRPGFFGAVLITLGLGVGGPAAVYGVVSGVLLTPLLYPEPERILAVQQRRLGQPEDGTEVSPANFLDWRDRSRSFAHLTAMEPFGLDWQSPDGPVYLPATLVFQGFFETFGVQPLLGRVPRPDEHEAGRGDVVVLGYEAWHRRFAGDSGVIGRVLRLDERAMTVIGVMPRGFGMPDDGGVWAPKVLGGWERQARVSNFYAVFGRLRPGVTRAEAQAELDHVAAQLAREHPVTNAGLRVGLVTVSDRLVGGVRRMLLLLLGTVTLVLLAVGANVASMQLARALARQREFAVKTALGAGRDRIARQLLAENLILAGLGAGLGFLVAHLALRAIRALAPPSFPRIAEITADAGVLGFALALSLAATIAGGVLPGLLAARRGRGISLGDAGRGATWGLPMNRLQAILVTVQIALSVVLLIGAGLLVRSFVALLDEERGFRTDGVVTSTVQSWGYYPDTTARIAFVRQVVERLTALPGVTAAGMASAIPLMETIGAEQAVLAVEGSEPLKAGEPEPRASYAAMTPGAFDALGIGLLVGRPFDRRDQANAPRVAIVNQSFARRHFGERDPIGRRIGIGRRGDQPPVPDREIVGVVRDVRRSALSQSAVPTVYLSYPQSPTGANAFVVHGTARPEELLAYVRRTVWEINPTIPIYGEHTMAELLGASVRDRVFLLAILAGFAVMALGLAAAGLFGLMSWMTAVRTREIGIRMAFGARSDQVLGLVLRRGLGLAAIGVAVGMVAGAGGARLLAGMLHRVGTTDPITFLAGAAVLLLTALAASWYPAWRAARTDPVATLRAE